jgi:hypothetical protein
LVSILRFYLQIEPPPVSGLRFRQMPYRRMI